MIFYLFFILENKAFNSCVKAALGLTAGPGEGRGGGGGAFIPGLEEGGVAGGARGGGGGGGAEGVFWVLFWLTKVVGIFELSGIVVRILSFSCCSS